MTTKFLLIEEEPLVTVISALWESDESILIAADSGVTEMPSLIRTRTDNKLRSHSAGILAWSVSGNASIGDSFSKWLEQYKWPPLDWDTLKDEVAHKLAELNGRQRTLCKLAGVDPKPDDLTEAIVVGYLDSLVMFDVDDVGHAGYIPRDRDYLFQAIGSGGPHAKLINIAFRHVGVRLQTAVMYLNEVMKVAIHTDQRNSDYPVHMWRVSNQGIKDLAAELELPPKSQTESRAQSPDLFFTELDFRSVLCKSIVCLTPCLQVQ